MLDLINPSKIFNWIEKFINFFNSIFFVLLIVALTFALIISPPDYLQSDSVRIMYVHVPSAWIALASFTSIAILSILSFIFKIKNFNLFSKSIAPIGLLFTFLAIVTGALWGQPTWGTWWVWDARLTSELVLFFIYLGHIFVSNAYDDKSKGDRYASILTLLGIVNLPIIKWSVDWWNTLHQPASISKFSSPNIASEMLWPLFLMVLSFLFFFISLLLLRIKSEIIVRILEVLETQLKI